MKREVTSPKGATIKAPEPLPDPEQSGMSLEQLMGVKE